MIARNRNKNIIITIIIYLYVFFIIYMPRISDLLINIPIEVFSVVILYFMIIPWSLISNKKPYILKNDKNVLSLIAGIIVSGIYFAIRAALASNDIRIFQNTFIIIQIIHIIIIIDFMKLIGYKKDDMIKVLLNLGLIQGIICIFMLIFPQFKNLALSLHYLGGEENVFISRMRIYGISGDYTYFTPIYHGILATMAFYYTVFKDKKYLIYVPFLLIAIILNGRFGLIVFLVGMILGTVYLFFKGKVSSRMIRFTILSLIFLLLGILILNILSPHTYNWIIGGFEDTINYITGRGKTGNYSLLVDTMLYFPEGVGMFFGKGHRVYSYHGGNRGYVASDIGFVNDLFMGGLIYITILYGTIFRFVLQRNSEKIINNSTDIYVDSLISMFLISALLISNYKGEAMRGGPILLGVIFIKMILIQPSET